MEKVKRTLRGGGKVSLAVLGGVLMPIMIWVALGVALSQRVRERRARRKPAPTIGEILATAGLTMQAETSGNEAMAAKVFMQQPASEIGKLLAKAGLTIHDEGTPQHCWEVLHCPREKRDACPAYVRRDVPSWIAVGLGKGGLVSKVCVNSTLVDLKTMPSHP